MFVRLCVIYELRILGSVRLLVKPLVLICTADLLGEKNTVPWLISRLIMAAEHSLSCPVSFVESKVASHLRVLPQDKTVLHLCPLLFMFA